MLFPSVSASPHRANSILNCPYLSAIRDKPELVPDLLKGAEIDAPGYINDFNEWNDRRLKVERNELKLAENITEPAKQPNEN